MAERRHREVDVGAVRLHVVEAGAGPLVVLLHGFPEYWAAWRRQIDALAGAGYRVVAPDQRGYGRSDKPKGVAAYHTRELAADVAGLIAALGDGEKATVVGHDWGGAVSWTVPLLHPECVERLVVMNAPHPALFERELRKPRQLLRSWYMLFFQLPWLPEAVLRARNFRALTSGFVRDPADPSCFREDDLEGYREAFREPGALTGAVNWYRAAFRVRRGLRQLVETKIEIPTMLVWGMEDRYLGPHLLDGIEERVPGIRVERLEGVSHWVQHEAAERVNALLLDFLGAHRSR